LQSGDTFEESSMRIIVKAILVVGAAVLLPLAASAQTTNTNCNINGQWVNCTSTTQPPPSGGAAQGIKDALDAHAARVAASAPARIAEEKLRQDQATAAAAQKARNDKETAQFLYCRQNPSKETVVDGVTKSCADFIEYEKASCLVNPGKDICNLARSKAEVEKAFADLTDKFHSDHPNRRSTQLYYESLYAKTTRWACMSFPDMTVPQWGGGQHACPDAPAAPAVTAEVK
jgi:hypothetical protein